MTRLIAVLALLLAAAGAAADEAKIRRVVEAALGGVRIEGIQPAPLPGFFEVRFTTREGPQIIYTDPDASFILEGSLYDTRNRRNVTEDRLRKLSAISFDSLPLDLAVKVQRGNGKRVLAMFSDPYCPACRQFEQTLAQVDDITIYYFMYPVIRPELADHSRAVWCSPDRAKAWLDLAARPKPRPAAAAAASCETPIERVLELGKSLRVSSTPTLFFANGERLRGGLPAAQLREVLDDSARDARATTK
jgi:thiol:disulfide interchange protein DsbC